MWPNNSILKWKINIIVSRYIIINNMFRYYGLLADTREDLEPSLACLFIPLYFQKLQQQLPWSRFFHHDCTREHHRLFYVSSKSQKRGTASRKISEQISLTADINETLPKTPMDHFYCHMSSSVQLQVFWMTFCLSFSFYSSPFFPLCCSSLVSYLSFLNFIFILFSIVFGDSFHKQGLS